MTTASPSNLLPSGSSKATRVFKWATNTGWLTGMIGLSLSSGQLRRLFYTEPRMPVSGSYWTTYQVDKDGVYALGESHEGHVITLFFMPWDGKEWREIFTTDKLSGYLKEGWFSGELKVQSFAVRPGWNGGTQ